MVGRDRFPARPRPPSWPASSASTAWPAPKRQDDPTEGIRPPRREPCARARGLSAEEVARLLAAQRGAQPALARLGSGGRLLSLQRQGRQGAAAGAAPAGPAGSLERVDKFPCPGRLEPSPAPFIALRITL